MNRIDELLNKYLDNELQPNELEEMKEFLKDDEVLGKLKALQMVDNSLHRLEYETVSAEFTEKFMQKVTATKKLVKIPRNYFATTVNVIFILLIIVILGFIFGNFNWSAADKGLSPQINKSVDEAVKQIPAYLSIFKNKSVLFFGAFCSIILLIGAYYTVEAHKAFKKRMDSLFRP